MCLTDLFYKVQDMGILPACDPQKVCPGLWGIIKRSVFNGGPSSTRIVYVSSGLLCAIGLTVATLAYTGVYVWKKVADPNFGLFLTSAWGILFGFAQVAQSKKNKLQEASNDDAPVPKP